MSATAAVDVAARAFFEPFRVLDEPARRAQLEGYRDFLARRDGVMDFEAGTLSAREPFFAGLDEGPHWQEPVDLDAFYQHYYGVGSPPLDDRLAWLLAVATANEGESYGVESEIRRWKEKGLERAPSIVLYDLLEERYHGLLLERACRTAGLPSLRFKRPALLQRLAILTMQRLPEQLRYVPVICGETLGCVVFRHLRDAADVFAAQPRVRDRLRTLLDEILVDEIGHVLYCRATLGPTALGSARRLMPWVTRALLGQVPQLGRLGMDAQVVAQRLSEGIPLPPAYDWLTPDRSSPPTHRA